MTVEITAFLELKPNLSWVFVTANNIPYNTELVPSLYLAEGLVSTCFYCGITSKDHQEFIGSCLEKTNKMLMTRMFPLISTGKLVSVESFDRLLINLVKMKLKIFVPSLLLDSHFNYMFLDTWFLYSV